MRGRDGRLPARARRRDLARTAGRPPGRRSQAAGEGQDQPAQQPSTNPPPGRSAARPVRPPTPRTSARQDRQASAGRPRPARPERPVHQARGGGGGGGGGPLGACHPHDRQAEPGTGARRSAPETAERLEQAGHVVPRHDRDRCCTTMSRPEPPSWSADPNPRRPATLCRIAVLDQVLHEPFQQHRVAERGRLAGDGADPAPRASRPTGT